MTYWLGALIAMTATDIAWVYAVRKVRDDSALQAGFWAVAQFLTYTIAVLLCVDKIEMLIPSAAGAFVGTAGGVWLAQRKER
jgi:hypothetical protein